MPGTMAFKEWSVICEALGSGRQALILRKGGIHEGRRGFQFEHPEFALFPTRFHEQEQGVRATELPPTWTPPQGEYAPGDPVEIRHWARLEARWTVADWARIESLEALHIWGRQTVRERFEWARDEGDPPALNVALVRVFAMREAWSFPYERGHGGCRSWLQLQGQRPPLGAPAMTDTQFAALRTDLRERLGAPA